jgi:5-methyltetrahydropteroyltriglutamate--homocysteine methyltransferase
MSKTSAIITHNLGYPRIGEQRELKQAVEAYWAGRLAAPELEAVGRELRATAWEKQRKAGIDVVPCGDFSFYDHVLDTSIMLGNVPPRFGRGTSGPEPADLESAFVMARGVTANAGEAPVAACEMTKWFDTNYHYIVPELDPERPFVVDARRLLAQFEQARALGVRARPVLIGPVTYLSLGKLRGSDEAALPAEADRFSRLLELTQAYVQVLGELLLAGAAWVQLDEPVLATDLTPEQRSALAECYSCLRSSLPNLRLLLTSYFGPLGDNLELACALPNDALHVDATRTDRGELIAIARAVPAGRALSVGIVDGRNVWKNDLGASLELLNELLAILGPKRLWLAPSCSLLHVPVTLESEAALDPELESWLAFADQKLAEVSTLRDLLVEPARTTRSRRLAENQAVHRQRRQSPRIHIAEVHARIDALTDRDELRGSRFSERRAKQAARLDLPAFPTTTIGSFPQTKEVRQARARFKRGALGRAEYQRFLERITARCIRLQEELGLDVLVHGEFERNDMVEYFGEQLDGFAFTQHGWVQSYGSRCVKPPILYGDVRRPKPITLAWTRYAQSLTKKPVKGMLTGPVTILQWSFVRDDQPRSVTAQQIALALRDEVVDLERAGTAVIQIDEPALREGLPLRRSAWADYLRWAVHAFRLSAGGVRDETQIHTHMCYAEFRDILPAVKAMDADVISVETARSNMELLHDFAGFDYPNDIGPGVFDIHSPRVPLSAEIVLCLKRAASVLASERIWVNPDCGLKTRDWREVTAALKAMVSAAQELRQTTGAGLAPRSEGDRPDDARI